VAVPATKKKSTTISHHQRSCSMQIQSTIMIPDDNLSVIPGLQYAPKICVDYLSHEWTQEDDIWTSWKVMSKQKKELSNGIRLENASWRTWAKQKYNLKTVNPKKLNWLKESDVTWLYGPLHTSNIETSPKLQNTEDKLNLFPATTSTKSCLKKKSISEILRPKGRYGPLLSSNSDSQLYKKEKEKERENYSDASDCETASTCSSISGPTTPTTGPTKLPGEKRKIQFNDRVEQCIAVESDQDVDELNDSDSSDDGLVMKNSPPKKKKDLSTICKLAPTKLKEDRIHNNEYSSLYSSSRRRANSSSSSSNTVPSTSNSTTSSSTQDQSWMYDDDDDLDLDLIDFDTAISTTYHPTEPIIPPPNNFNEEDDEDKDDIVDKAVNIANGVREIMHWCSDMVLKGRIF